MRTFLINVRGITVCAIFAALFAGKCIAQESAIQPAPKLAQRVHITPEYSNAVFNALLPHFNEFVGKANLGISSPLKPSQIREFHPDPFSGVVGGTLILTNGFRMSFGVGVVAGFYSPRDYFILQEPKDIPKFYGVLRMNRDEALALARQTIKNLGYREKDVTHGWPLDIWGPRVIGTNTVPFYIVKWEDPETELATKFDVDAENRRIVGMMLSTSKIKKPDPKIDVVPELEKDFRQRMKGDARPLTETNAPSKLRKFPPKSE